MEAIEINFTCIICFEDKSNSSETCRRYFLCHHIVCNDCYTEYRKHYPRLCPLKCPERLS